MNKRMACLCERYLDLSFHFWIAERAGMVILSAGESSNSQNIAREDTILFFLTDQSHIMTTFLPCRRSAQRESLPLNFSQFLSIFLNFSQFLSFASMHRITWRRKNLWRKSCKSDSPSQASCRYDYSPTIFWQLRLYSGIVWLYYDLICLIIWWFKVALISLLIFSGNIGGDGE